VEVEVDMRHATKELRDWPKLRGDSRVTRMLCLGEGRDAPFDGAFGYVACRRAAYTARVRRAPICD
jgi:hypothetical protein